MTKPISKADSLRELKNYLIFLRDYGYSEIPAAASLNPPERSGASVPPTDNPMPRENPIKPASAAKNVEEAAQKLLEIREDMGDCTRCKLCNDRKTIVFGSGNPEADLVFVGEGPGADEDAQGLPFVGRAGKKLTEIIEKGMKLNREKDTYICNIVKCRPPGNRDPEKEEIAACKPFLLRQLQAIQPKVIVALGKPAASTLLGRPVPITKERGTWHEFEGVKLMLTYHPAYLLRFYTLENRKAVLSDMQKVLDALAS